MKIKEKLSNLDVTDTASLIHTASEAIRQGCTFARAYSDLTIYISSLENEGFLLEDFCNISEKREIINLIIAASFRLQTLSR